MASLRYASACFVNISVKKAFYTKCHNIYLRWTSEAWSSQKAFLKPFKHGFWLVTLHSLPSFQGRIQDDGRGGAGEATRKAHRPKNLLINYSWALSHCHCHCSLFCTTFQFGSFFSTGTDPGRAQVSVVAVGQHQRRCLAVGKSGKWWWQLSSLVAVYLPFL